MRGMRLISAALCLGVLAACSPTEVQRSVSYDDRFEQTVMDLYLPAGPETARPGVMLVHGGGWTRGSRLHFAETAARLSRAGYVVANVEYRLIPDGVYPAAVQDVGCALMFLQDRAGELGLDADRLAVMGYSAGGHLVSLVALAGDHAAHLPDCAVSEGRTFQAPAAVVSGAGVHDLTGEAVRIHPSIGGFMGGTFAEKRDAYERASPIFHLSTDAPPFLFIAGNLDPLLPQQKRMHEGFAELGVDTELLVVTGAAHMATGGVDGGARRVAMSTESAEAWVVLGDFLAQTVGVP